MVCVGVHRSSEHTSLHPGKESQLPHRGDPAVITTYPANTPRERERGGGGGGAPLRIPVTTGFHEVR